jgi:excisionase family DNA binding protein
VKPANSKKRRGMNDFMDVKECAEYLRIKPSTIYKWISTSKRNASNTIPFIKIHGRVLFRTTEVLQWAMKFQVEDLK